MTLHGTTSPVNNQLKQQLLRKSIEDRCKEYTGTVNQRIKTLEPNLQENGEITDLEKLQKRVEENENKMKEIQENNVEEPG